MQLNLPHGHAAGVERHDLVIEARPAGLVLADELGFEGALAVARNVQRPLAELSLERLRAMPVAGIASDICHRVALVVAQVFGHFGFAAAPYQHLGQLLEQTILAYQIFGILVVRQQAVGQLHQLGVWPRSLGAFRYGHPYS